MSTPTRSQRRLQNILAKEIPVPESPIAPQDNPQRKVRVSPGAHLSSPAQFTKPKKPNKPNTQKNQKKKQKNKDFRSSLKDLD